MKRLLLALFVLPCALTAFAGTYFGDKFFIDGDLRAVYMTNSNVPDKFAPAGTMASYVQAPTRLFLGAGYDINKNITLFARGAFLTLWGSPGGQPFFTDSQVDRVQLTEAYIDFKKLTDFLSVRVGRQFYAAEEVFFEPNWYNFERLVYTALDGVVFTIDIPSTTINIIGGREAPLSDFYDKDAFTYGFQTKTDISELFGFYTYFYNRDQKYGDNIGRYGVKPYINYGGFEASFQYLRLFDDSFRRFSAQGQFFKFDISREYKKEGSYTLTPRGSVTWTTGGQESEMDFTRNLIVEDIFGSQVLIDHADYNLSLDAAFDAVPDTLFTFESFYYQGRRGAPDIGTELNLLVKYTTPFNLELGVGAGYLFANRAFQSKDASKLQTWLVYRF